MACRPFILALALCLLSRVSAAETTPPRSDDPAGPRKNPEALRPRAGTFSVAVLFGANYGADVGIRGNRLMFGFGGRAGYSFETTPLYLGVTVFGYGHEVEYDDTTETGTEHYVDVDLDIGLELQAKPLILRPYLGLGTMLGIYEGPAGGNSGISLHAAPGLLVRYPLGPIDIGADGRLEASGIGPTTVSLLGNVGVAF